MPQIMVVDDNPDVRELLSVLLRKNGHEVIESNNGWDCLNKLKGGARPDLILLDVMMPKLDGWAVSREVKEDENLRHTMICILTVKNSEVDFEMSLKYAHADWHLNKPVSKNNLIKVVNWLLLSKKIAQKPSSEKPVKDWEEKIGRVDLVVNPKFLKSNYDFLGKRGYSEALN
jgi:CheY-like chemotaxis protein